MVKLTDNSKEKEESRKKLIEKAAIPVNLLEGFTLTIMVELEPRT